MLERLYHTSEPTLPLLRGRWLAYAALPSHVSARGKCPSSESERSIVCAYLYSHNLVLGLIIFYVLCINNLSHMQYYNTNTYMC